MKIKLPFGMKDGRLLHVHDAERGAACDCTCPACGHPLIAKKGESTVHHFAHDKGKECEHAVETALHLAAKEIIERVGWMYVPATAVTLGDSARVQRQWELSAIQKMSFERVELERRLGGVVPDVIAYSGGRPLLIEITVTHRTGEEKIRAIQKSGLSVLEIDLSRAEREVPLDELEHVVIGPSKQKKWLLNQKVTWMKEMIQRFSTRVVIEEGKRCPLGVWNISRSIRDGLQIMKAEAACGECPNFGGYERKGYTPVVQCLGPNKISSAESMKTYLENIQASTR